MCSLTVFVVLNGAGAIRLSPPCRLGAHVSVAHAMLRTSHIVLRASSDGDSDGVAASIESPSATTPPGVPDQVATAASATAAEGLTTQELSTAVAKFQGTADRIAAALERIAAALEVPDGGDPLHPSPPPSEPAASAPPAPEQASRVDWQTLSDDVYLEQLQAIGLEAERSGVLARVEVAGSGSAAGSSSAAPSLPAEASCPERQPADTSAPVKLPAFLTGWDPFSELQLDDPSGKRVPGGKAVSDANLFVRPPTMWADSLRQLVLGFPEVSTPKLMTALKKAGGDEEQAAALLRDK